MKGSSIEGVIAAGKQEAELIRLARLAALNAYAPYSRFKVGAALITEKGGIFSGCNVENVSYGLTCCAERVAIFSAIAAEGPSMRIQSIAITTEPRSNGSPCGACRQVIYEFGPESLVVLDRSSGGLRLSARDLLPLAFSPQALPS